MRIGILQTGHLPEPMQSALGDYPEVYGRLLADFQFELPVWDVSEGVFPESPLDADGWLITGSRFGAYENHAWIPPLEALIREIVAAGRPLVGICFGHQIIAQSLGGKVEKFGGGWKAGRTKYAFEDGESLALNAWHQDQVITPPPGARTIATADGCAYAGFVIGPNVMTFQAHPEFGVDEIEALLEHRGSVIPSDIRAGAEAGLSRPLDNAKIAQRIADFFRAGEVSHVA